MRTKNFNPTGHTRLPRYARAKIGTIDAVLDGRQFDGRLQMTPHFEIESL